MSLSPRQSRSRRRTANTTVAEPTLAEPNLAESNPLSNQSSSGALSLEQVEHELSYPKFDPNHFFAGDLFADSSPLPRTSKTDADAAVASIEEKKQTLRIVQANLSLNQEVVGTGILYQKFLGGVIDYGTAKVNNRTKLLGYETAGVNFQIADTKLRQAQERLTHEAIALTGLTELTPLLREEWEQRKALKQSRIEDLKQSVFKANAKLDEEIKRIADTVSGDLGNL